MKDYRKIKAQEKIEKPRNKKIASGKRVFCSGVQCYRLYSAKSQHVS